jgi:hypothetical protein
MAVAFPLKSRREGEVMNNIRITVEELPELETEVGIAGSVKQQEVGAILCLGVAAGIAIYLGA